MVIGTFDLIPIFRFSSLFTRSRRVKPEFMKILMGNDGECVIITLGPGVRNKPGKID